MDSIRFFVFCVGLFFLMGCRQEDSWTKDEVSLLEDSAYGKMRVLQLTCSKDSSALRQKAHALCKEDIQSRNFGLLVNGLLRTVTDKQNQGVGIAAPHIGISRQVIALQRFDKEGEPFEVMVNPNFHPLGKNRSASAEGSIIASGKYNLIFRYDSISISFRDPINFSLCQDTLTDFTARIFQHEWDQLNGTLFSDHLLGSSSPQ